MRIEAVDDEAFVATVHAAGLAVPIEQAPVWDAFDAAVPGRAAWGRLRATDDAGSPRAVVSFTSYQVRGFTYLWAKHGPVWLAPPTAADERDLREALRAYLRAEFPAVVFARIHAKHEAPDLAPVLQSVTYDETVMVDLTLDEEALLMSMGKTGRKKLRRTLRDEGFVFSEERGIDAAGFEELHAIYRETAARDGFGIFAADVYRAMLTSLGDAARLFVARRVDGDGKPGRAVSWVISTFHEGVGQDYYGASNAEGLETNAALALKWHILTSLKAEGGTRYDMMGVGSARAPQLMGVRQFKLQFADETTPVDPSWDVPVRRLAYRGLRAALLLKRLVRL